LSITGYAHLQCLPYRAFSPFCRASDVILSSVDTLIVDQRMDTMTYREKMKMNNVAMRKTTETERIIMLFPAKTSHYLCLLMSVPVIKCTAVYVYHISFFITPYKKAALIRTIYHYNVFARTSEANVHCYRIDHVIECLCLLAITKCVCPLSQRIRFYHLIYILIMAFIEHDLNDSCSRWWQPDSCRN